MQSLKGFVGYTKKTLSVKDTYAVRANSVALGMSLDTFIEVVGFAVADEIGRNRKNKSIAVVCGRGEKGACGLSTARHLLRTANVSVFFIGDPSTINNNTTRLNYNLVKNVIEIRNIGEEQAEQLAKSLAKFDVIVDAILGCGLKGRLSSLLTKAITAINKSGREVLSIDIPSGLDADTGMPNRAYVKADHTFVIHKMKQGIERNKLVGSTTLVNVGVPIAAELFAGPGDVMLATEPRPMQANKYTHGRILIIGGSKDYHGAPLIAAFAAENTMSALLSGAGYATIAVPAEVVEPVRKLSMELIVKPLDLGNTAAAISAISAIKHDALVIGPGMEQSEENDRMILEIIKSEKAKGNTIIVDADATRVMAKHKDMLSKNIVLTPHDGEFRNFSGINLKGLTPEERIRKAIGVAKPRGFTLVLKGNETVITNGELLKINRSETPALATIGTGDALDGIIASYSAVHKNSFESAVAAVYVHSRVGDMLYSKKGLHITSQDVLSGIPDVLKQFDTLRF